MRLWTYLGIGLTVFPLCWVPTHAFLEGVPLAFGSDCMPLDPLFGVEQTVTAPTEQQRLTVTEALRAYTAGAAYAGFDEHRLGTIETGQRADLVVLDRSPWAVAPAAIASIDVTHTIMDGRVVYS